MPGKAKTAHPKEEVLRDVAAGRRVTKKAAAHVEDCKRCTREVEMFRALGQILETGRTSESCPDLDALLGYSEGMKMRKGEREALDAHLTRCVRCAAEVEGLARAGKKARRLPVPRVSVRQAARNLEEGLQALVSWSMPLSVAVAARATQQGAPGQATYRKAMEHYRAGRYGRAAQGLRKAIREGGAAAEMHFYLGVCLLHKSALTEAVEALEEAVRRPPRLGEYHWYLAQAYLQTGRGEEALAHLRKTGRLPGPYRDKAKELAGEVRAVMKSVE
jgi:tetratricopeptide (TPR) repeat protein